jgi:hypothetical protein
MSALEALVLAGKGLNAFSVLFTSKLQFLKSKTAIFPLKIYRFTGKLTSNYQ